jgi:zinc and cadmium transporter
MNNIIYALSAALIISIISIVGIFFVGIRGNKLNKILLVLLSFSAGALLGGAFFHLLPEAIEEFGEPHNIFKFALFGMAGFYILERVLRWHHCHEGKCDTHKHLGVMNLVGDGVHNLIDGIVLASAFVVDVRLGVAVAISIAMHEIPQEIGDFGVLVYAGFSKFKALMYNFLSAAFAILGVVIGYILVDKVESINMFLLPFAAGGFIYIAMSDLIPELHKESSFKKSFLYFVVLIIAVLFMFFLA